MGGIQYTVTRGRDGDFRPRYGQNSNLNFQAVNRAALVCLPDLLAQWLPDGSREGAEWVARNPLRPERRDGNHGAS